MSSLRFSSRKLHSALKHPLSYRFASTGSRPQRSVLETGFYASAFVVSAVMRYTLDPESSHKFALRVLRSGLGPRDSQADDDTLKFEVWGNKISNPIGLAAGFDKEGEAIDGLFNLGFSWVEIGSVTPKPQPGNPRPRVFLLPEDSALINRYGFPSQGHASVLSRIRSRIPAFSPLGTPASFRPGSLLAVNLGKNKSSSPDSIDDFVSGVRTFGPYADVLVVNVSSPNTPGLRNLQSRALLTELLTGVTEARNTLSQRPKLVVKIAPDLNESELVDIAYAITKSGIDGVIVSNTTTQRPTNLANSSKTEQGGLSGAPLKKYTLSALKTLRSHLPASIPLIGCGGIFTGADALEYGKAGACLVQIYTSFGYDGVGTCRRIKDELSELLAKDGTTWESVVNQAVNELSFKQPEKQTAEGSISLLIEEAKELGKLLDEFGETFGKESSKEIMAIPPTAS